MRRSTLFCAIVEYDDERVDADKVADQFGKFIAPNSLGEASINRFVPLEHGVRLTIADACVSSDESDTPNGLTLEIVQTPFGVDVLALNAFGERFAAVSLDYFDNRVRALAWEGFDDEPVSAQVICEDVRNAVNTRLGSDISACSDSSGAETTGAVR